MSQRHRQTRQNRQGSQDWAEHCQADSGQTSLGVCPGGIGQSEQAPPVGDASISRKAAGVFPAMLASVSQTKSQEYVPYECVSQ